MSIDRLRRQLKAAMLAHLGSGYPPCVPEAGRLAWQWFDQLHATRSWHNTGPNPVSHAEIAAWATLMRWPLHPHHVLLIRTLDDAWLDHFRERQKLHATGGKSLPVPSKHEMTPELFDALFG